MGFVYNLMEVSVRFRDICLWDCGGSSFRFWLPFVTNGIILCHFSLRRWHLLCLRVGTVLDNVGHTSETLLRQLKHHLLHICCNWSRLDLPSFLLTAIPYRASTGPEQVFPCVVFPVRKTTQGKPCFHYRDGFAVLL